MAAAWTLCSSSSSARSGSLPEVWAGQGYKDLVEIEIGDDSIVATVQHPFWLLDDQEWVDAKDLHVGSALRTSAGTRVEVTAVRKWTAVERVHNLTVDGIHTYHVLAGARSVLVHNAGPCDPVLANGASLEGISPSEMRRIQNAANSRGVSISVVGSRGKGPKSDANPKGYHAGSDWDYVITGANARLKSRIASSFPCLDVTAGVGRRSDIMNGKLIEGEPSITFRPQG